MALFFDVQDFHGEGFAELYFANIEDLQRLSAVSAISHDGFVRNQRRRFHYGSRWQSV